MAATRNYARHLRVITVLQTKSRQLRNLITRTKRAIILKQILKNQLEYVTSNRHKHIVQL